MAIITLWPYKPAVGMSEVIEWQTDVIKCRSAETRAQVRDYPRNSISCRFHLTGDAQFSEAKYYAKTTEPDAVRVPWWPVYFNVGAVLSTDTVLQLNNADEWYSASDSVFITEALSGTYVEKTVQSATSSTLTLTSTVGTAFTSAIVAPLLTVLTDGFSFSRSGDHIITASAKFTSVFVRSNANQIFGNYGVTDIPLVDTVSKLQGTVEESISKNIYTNDGETGNIGIFDDETYFRHYQMLKFVTNGYSEKRAIRRFLHWMKGKLNPFYLPTWVDEVESPEYTLVRSDTDRLEILHTQYNSYTVSIPVVEVLESESS